MVMTVFVTIYNPAVRTTQNTKDIHHEGGNGSSRKEHVRSCPNDSELLFNTP